MESFVARITPLTDVGQPPDGEKPPGIWGGAGEPFPTPPIYLPPEKPGQPPILIWGGGNQPFPTPPIVIPPIGGGERPPLVIWGGGNQPFPTPPIYLPPVTVPGDPPIVWVPVFPTPPIHLPPTRPPGNGGTPDIPPPSEPTGPTTWVVWYNPKYGYKVVKLGDSPA